MRLLLILLCISYSWWCQAQNRQQLEKKRQLITHALSKTNQELQSTRYRKKRTKQQLRQLTKQLAQQTALLDSLQLIQKHTATRQAKHTLVVAALELDLANLRIQHRSAIRSLYRQQQLKKRIPVGGLIAWSKQQYSLMYCKHIHQQRHHQVECIQGVQQDLVASVEFLQQTHYQQDTLLQELSSDHAALNRNQQQQTRKMTQLHQKERQLSQTLAQQKTAKQLLSKKIEQAILKQIAAAKASARKYQAQQRQNQTVNSRKAPLAMTDAATENFAAQRGKLLSPIYHGKIVGHYGTHAHPTFKDVMINNNGIDLSGQYNSVVRNVHIGTVVSVFAIPGLNNAVMVKHGDYYTTYSNIAKVYVKQGQQLKTGAQIGTIGRAPKGKGYLLHFELWHNKQKQNPLPWIRPKGRL